MYLNDLVNRGNIAVLEKMMAYAEARHMVLAENIANIDTPDYKVKQLDPKLFQQTLRQAIDDRGSDPTKRLILGGNDEFHTDDRGSLVVTPATEPAHNILFHDRTNARVEVLMSQLAENFMAYNMVSQMLKNSFDGLKTAIRGQV